MTGSCRLLVIHNPTAGRRRRRRLDAVLHLLSEAGCTITLVPTAKRGDAEDFAATAIADDVDLLVAAGGDGTLNEVANGLVRRRELGLPPLPLAIVPLGTANVLAAEIGLPEDAEAIARTILTGAPRRIYPGIANGRRFLCMAGSGLDAFVVQDVNHRLKRLLGKGAYALETLRRLWLGSPEPYRLLIDGKEENAAQIILAKGHFYGGTFVIAPAARLDEPLLWACLFRRGGRWAALRYILAVMLGVQHRLGDIEIVPVRRVSIEGQAADPVQGDGDIVTRLPADIGIDEDGLDLVFPA